MKRYLLLLVAALACTYAHAQEWGAELFNKPFEVLSTKSKGEPFKGQVIKKSIDGMGVMKRKDGSLYVGDFVKGEISGMGMMISANDTYIDNCDQCSVYIGYWRNGLKVGKGACYGANGDLLYYGSFKENAPADNYPSTYASQARYFTLIDSGSDDIFLGEMCDGLFNGFGVVIKQDGDLLISGFDDGNPSGLALYLTYDGQWQTLSFKGSECTTVTSSSRYKQVSEAHKQSNKQIWGGLLNDLAGLTVSSISLANDIHTINHGGSSSTNYVSTNSGSNSTVSGSSKTNSASSGSDSNTSASSSAAWRSDSKVYHNWESRIIDMKAYPEKYDNYSRDYKEAQTKMREIRLKWESRGYKITKSPYED